MPHGRIAACLNHLDGSLVVLVKFEMHGTSTDLVKNIHGGKTNGAQGQVSCRELGLRSAVTNNG